MNVLDSSGWLAYFADEPNAQHFAAPLRRSEELIVPAVVIYEVFKVMLREAGENQALEAYGAMQRGDVVDVTPALAVSAARLSLRHKLPMADSFVLATARERQATLWTQDEDFDGIPGVRFLSKGRR